MHLTRHITHEDESPYAGISWKSVDVEICAADAEARVCLTDIEVPAHWSYEAAETFVRYYLRKAGVPASTTRVREEGLPEWLWRSVPDTAALMGLPAEERTTHETSARQVFARMAGMWTYWGFRGGYFDSADDARAFHDEICALLARQMMAPNSPQWFNAGLHWAYGMTGPAQGHFHGEISSARLMRSANAYERPQLAACFLHSVKDELVNEGGIMHLFEREVRAFKYGSGVGVNMSSIRGSGETLSGGAHAAGLKRFLSVGDKAAGAISSGGLPRRAGKMVVVDIDHPEVLDFIRWKGEEQYKAAALITGARAMREHLSAVMCATEAGEGEARFEPTRNPLLKKAIAQARAALIPGNAIARVLHYARQGYRELHIPLYSAQADSEIFFTIGAHQGKHAVRVSGRFMQAAEDKHRFALRRRTDGVVVRQEEAAELLDELAHAVWATGEPTIQFADAIEMANPCPDSGPIRASTPASEYLFLDDTACPLAAINLLALADAKGNLDLKLFSHVVRLVTVMLDISVGIAQYPSREMARRTLDTRPLGIGPANFGGLVMRMGVAYDSPGARATAAAICGLLTAEAHVASAQIAGELGAFAEYDRNRAAYLRVLHARRAQAHGDFSALPQPELAKALERVWDVALSHTEHKGARNAQLSCVPPTATIARVMDCETLGLAPLATLLKSSALPGGGWRKSLSPNVTYGLSALGYSAREIGDIARHVCGHGTLEDAPGIDHDALRRKGFGEAEIRAVEEALASAVDIHSAFDPWVLGERFCREQLHLTDAQLRDARFKVLDHLGFGAQAIAQANRHACGAQHLGGAPHLKEEHAGVFATALTAAPGAPAVSAKAQLAVMGAAQPFLTGGIAHTILLPHEASTDECRDLIRSAWQAGLKSLSLSREACAIYEEVAGEETGEDSEVATLPFAVETNLPQQIPQLAAELAQRFLYGRRDLPPRRAGFTQKATIGGHPLYLRSGEYEDGGLGEIFLDMPGEAEAYRALLQQFARAISVALQYGVPLSAFVTAFAQAQFAPSGSVEGSELIAEASSVLDYIFRELDASYAKRRAVTSNSPEAMQADTAEIIPLAVGSH
ncbi:MAG: vitamin B12-dependent ribonucleotide reductase [Alphaproteobacteria bacterium]